MSRRKGLFPEALKRANAVFCHSLNMKKNSFINKKRVKTTSTVYECTKYLVYEKNGYLL